MSTFSPCALNLVDLPGEVRNRIYELVLNHSEEPVVCPFILESTPGKRKYGYSLTQTCRQIRIETIHMWHASSKLLFAMRAENMKHYLNWLHRRPKEVFASIRRIQLDDYQHCRVTASEHHSTFCKNAIIINLNKRMPVTCKKERTCFYCPSHDPAVDRVHAVVRTLEWQNGRWALTREKLEEMFEAAAWRLPVTEE